MKTNLRTRRALLLGASALALTVALTGCSALNDILGSGTADRDEETGQVTENSNVDVFQLKLGDCKLAEDSSGTEIQDVEIVPCTDPHDEEVYYEITMDDGEYSSDAIDAAVEECIGDAFTNFVGLAYNDSLLGVYPITPTEQSWNEANDRVIQCVIFDQDEAGNVVQVSTSLKGAAR